MNSRSLASLGMTTQNNTEDKEQIPRANGALGMTGRLFPAEVNRPYGTRCFSQGTRHFAALRAGLITIAPPALDTAGRQLRTKPRTKEQIPRANGALGMTGRLFPAEVNRPYGTRCFSPGCPALRCAPCRANYNRASGARHARQIRRSVVSTTTYKDKPKEKTAGLKAAATKPLSQSHGRSATTPWHGRNATLPFLRPFLRQGRQCKKAAALHSNLNHDLQR